MSRVRPSRLPFVPIVGGLIALAAVSALAVAGWSKHGEAIFLSMLQGDWANCF